MQEYWEYEDARLKEYNDELDEPGDVVIFEIPFRRSLILYEFDKVTYFQEYDSYKLRRTEERKQLIVNKFPSCIAFHYYLSQRGPSANNESGYFLHLKDTWEAIVFVLYALTWGEVRSKNISLSDADVYYSSNPVARFNSKILLTDAIKQKLENIKAIIQHSVNKGHNLLCEQHISFDLLNDLFQLQNNRNDFSHSAAPSPIQAREELVVIEPLMDSVLSRLSFLADVDFVRFDTFSTACRFEIFKGHSLNKEYETIRVDNSRLTYVMNDPGNIIFAKWQSELYSVSPFLHFVNDTMGYETYLSVFKGRRDSKFWYEPLKLRNEVSFDTLQTRFDAEKVELQQLFVS